MTYDVFADDSEHVVIGYQQMRIGYIAYCLGISASTLAGLRSGKLVAVPRERFEHWMEYWNKDRNETAMADALDFLEGEFSEVLAAAPAPKGGEDG